jgi:hypothetical protein
LGIRNLTWDDLKEFAGITQEQVTAIQYKKGGERPPIQEPKKKNGDAPKGDIFKIVTPILNITMKDGKKTDGTPYTLYTIVGQSEGQEFPFKTFDKTLAERAKAEKGSGMNFEVEYKTGKYGNDLVSLNAVIPGDDDNAQP